MSCSSSRSRFTSISLIAAVCAAALFASLAAPSPALSAQRPKAKIELKIATIAPEGSTWMRIMDELDAQVREKTQGEAGLKFYAGGVQGDELVVLRKIRAGQLHGGGFTGVGLGEIEPNLRVFEVPFTFRTTEEVDAVHRALDPTFDSMLREDGWEILGWANVGPVYLFTKQPVRQIDDLKKMRMWLWEGDPVAEQLLKTVGVSPVPLPITDVVTSLQTGLIDAVYNGPLACIALQWYTRVSYMTDIPVTQAMGAVVVSRSAFQQLSPAAQETVHALANEAFARLSRETERENAESLGVLQQKGIEVVKLEPGQAASFASIGKDVRESLAGRLYSQEMLDRALAAVEQHRTSTGNPTSKP